MHTRYLVVCNAYEPDNLIELCCSEGGSLMRIRANAQFRDGALPMLVGRSGAGSYVTIDGYARWCSTLDEAWEQVPTHLREPDHSYERR